MQLNLVFSCLILQTVLLDPSVQDPDSLDIHLHIGQFMYLLQIFSPIQTSHIY